MKKDTEKADTRPEDTGENKHIEINKEQNQPGDSEWEILEIDDHLRELIKERTGEDPIVGAKIPIKVNLRTNTIKFVSGDALKKLRKRRELAQEIVRKSYQ